MLLYLSCYIKSNSTLLKEGFRGRRGGGRRGFRRDRRGFRRGFRGFWGYGHYPIYNGNWMRIGIVYSEDKHEDSVYNLYEMRYHDGYKYKVNDRGVNILLNNGRKMRRLSTGDVLVITGKEKIGNFIVKLD